MAQDATARWDAGLYDGSFAFVWKHGGAMIDLLDPTVGMTVLDLGCGTGHLSHEIAQRGATVIGIDSSPAMVAQARINYPALKFMLADASGFTLPDAVDAVFSNAALHWVLKAEEAVRCVRAALKPGGRFVAEFGGKHNITAILAAVHAETGAENPWYFPSLGEYATLLEANRFRVVQASHFARPTKLEGARGMEDWLEMFGSGLLSQVDPKTRDAVVARIVDRLRPVLYRDGEWFADYVRLRIVAVAEG